MFEFFLIADSAGFFLGLLGVILFLISVFLIFIILIQRGKGGGIAGSLTGTAQSAFGARGGDILMWLTLSLTIIWILLCCVTIFFYSRVQDSIAEGRDDADIQTDIMSPSDATAEPNALSPNGVLGADDETEDDAASGDTPPAVNPTIETDDSDSGDESSVEDSPNIDEPESTDASDDDPQNEGATSVDKE